MPLSGKQQAVALSLAAGKTVTEAVREHGVSERTIRRWLAEADGFRPRIQELRTALFSDTVGRLADLSGRAAAALGELLDSDKDGVRLQAARCVLEEGPRLRESVDLAGQLEQLRAELEVLKRERRESAARNGTAGGGTAGAAIGQPVAGAGGPGEGPGGRPGGGGDAGGPVAGGGAEGHRGAGADALW
jgi:transposase-like protein